MKRLFALLLSAVLMLCAFCSCTKALPEYQKQDGRLTVVTTIFPYYDFLRNIADDKINLRLLLPPGSEPHDYEPSPSDIIDINNADLFIYTGGESDAWAESVLNGIDSSVHTLRLIDFVEPVMVEDEHEHHADSISDAKEEEHAQSEFDEGQDEHSHSDSAFEDDHQSEAEHGEGSEQDEHIWTSPENAVIITQTISTEIQKIDSENAEYYKSTTAEYLKKLNDLNNEFKKIREDASRDMIVFGDRFPIVYLAKELSLNYDCAFPGCSHDTEPGITTVKRLINTVRDNDIPVVFYLDFSNRAVADLLCEDSNAVAQRYHSCHNVSAEDFNSGVTYIDLMEQNACALREALN